MLLKLPKNSEVAAKRAGQCLFADWQQANQRRLGSRAMLARPAVRLRGAAQTVRTNSCDRFFSILRLVALFKQHCDHGWQTLIRLASTQ
jgi:hypothetical protein